MSQYLKRRFSQRSFGITGHYARAVVLFALLTSVAFTGGTRTLRGRVTDEQGHALVGAIVQVQSNSTFWVRSYITQSDGLYHFTGLFTDDAYRVQAKYNGIPSQTRALSKFTSRTLATVNLVVDLS
jgi:protocatechuate 3,4-dioxygenase beta subunit